MATLHKADMASKFLPLLAATAAVLPLAPAFAQSGGREVVQALPSTEVASLNNALKRLARNSRDLSALIDAGNAALALNDLDAAMGFFGRAQELSPNSGPAKMGMAAVFLRSERPVEALRLFAEAEKAGASVDAVLPERGLAFDLVGNNVEAQASYRAALARGANAEVSRRLALSQAIAGDRKGFEASLRPLLEKRDYAAYRTRAFGLAILGDAKEARDIADAVMPRDMSSRLGPYLDYMPRLTPAQQAAAANLGIFPRASQIGRDDPRIAQYASSGSPSAANAGSKLAPQGAPLGGPKPQPAAESSKRRKIAGASERRASAGNSSRLASVRQEQASAAAPSGNQGASFDLASTSGATTPAQPVQKGEPAPSVADAFGDFAGSSSARVSGGKGAVDITTIEVPREKPPEEVKPKPPAHPARAWVQVATGQDVSALKFDWRRISRKAPELLGDFKPHVTPWGQANRLLAGPVTDAAKARELVNALKEQGIDTFPYSSPEGEEIKLLQ